MYMREDKKSILRGTQNWDKYGNTLAFKELSGRFENPYVIPGHVGKLPRCIMFHTVRESITVY